MTTTWRGIVRAVCIGCVGIAAAFGGVAAAAEADRIEVRAGEPFGVARVHFSVDDPATVAHADARFNVGGAHERILYPVFIPDAVPFGASGPAATAAGFEALFLFRGSDPATIVVQTNLSRSPYAGFRATVDPAAAGTTSTHAELLERWWRAKRATLAEARRRDSYYPVIESYLAWRLAHLPGVDADAAALLAPPPRDLATRPLQGYGEVESLADILIGTESVRLALQTEMLLAGERTAGERATVPLPSAVALPSVDFPDAGKPPPALEPIASVTPAECLYVRFPRFSAFRRVRERLERLGGLLHDQVLGRALDAEARGTLETQLALEETALSKLFGDLVIGEVAVIARDTFVREGSALGVIFEIKNEALFRGALGELRRRTEARVEALGVDVGESVVHTPFGDVSLLAAPDNSVRSFHAVAGPFHLVTNCLDIAGRFLECAKDPAARSLARDEGFIHGRRLHPVGEAEDAFLFISDPFVRELIGPAYRAEMTRRTRARVELETIEVARRAAEAELGETQSISALIRNGYLPASIRDHPDVTEHADTPRGAVDKLRGRRGTFLPIPDVVVDRVTRAEAMAYEAFSMEYRRLWGRAIDPVAVRVRLSEEAAPAGGPALERLDLSIDILPFAGEPYRVLQAFAAPARERSAAPFEDEIVSAEIELRLFTDGRPTWLRGGIVDFAPALSIRDGALDLVTSATLDPVYFIAPAFEPADDATQLELPLLGRAAKAGEGLWRLDTSLARARPWVALAGEDKAVVTTEPALARRLAAAYAPRAALPAQARLRIADLAGRKIAAALALQARQRTWQASASGAELLSVVRRDLKVPLEECAEAARAILAAAVRCPAGGEYSSRAFPPGGGPAFWSQALPPRSPIATFGAVSPLAGGETEAAGDVLLATFAGLEVGLRLDGRSLHSDVTVRLRP